MRTDKRTLVAAGMAVAVLVTGSSLVASASSRHATHVHSATQAKATVSKRAFRNAMRKLWEDHIIWTRQFIVSDLADLPDTNTAAGRLLGNQEDIGDAIKPFYGRAAGDQLTGLLKDHILIAADILGAAKSGDSQGVADGQQRWDDNAVEIATFLSKANPDNWPRKMMVDMMREHLSLTFNEAAARLNQDWDADVAAFDEIHIQILHMADMLSAGIIAQFPNKF